MSPLIVSVSGIRGIVGESLFLETALGYASVLGESLAASHGLLAQATPPTAARPENKSDETTVELSPFEVTAAKDTGYQATETLAGTRIRTNRRP